LRIKRLAVLLAVILPLGGETVRSRKALDDFARTHPCPSSGLAQYHGCAGFVVDHTIPLCACHHDPRCLAVLDKPENMAWQAITAAKQKDRRELAACRAVPQASAK
jgi:hypothetical protein